MHASLKQLNHHATSIGPILPAAHLTPTVISFSSSGQSYNARPSRHTHRQLNTARRHRNCYVLRWHERYWSIGRWPAAKWCSLPILLLSGARSLDAYYDGDAVYAPSTSPAVGAGNCRSSIGRVRSRGKYITGDSFLRLADSVAAGDFNGDGSGSRRLKRQYE